MIHRRKKSDCEITLKKNYNEKDKCLRECDGNFIYKPLNYIICINNLNIYLIKYVYLNSKRVKATKTRPIPSPL